MKKICIASFLLFFAFSCKDKDQQSAATSNDIDAARSFIQAALNSDFDKAREFMLQDSLNLQDLEQTARLNRQMSNEEKMNYKEASIRIHSHRVIDDSTSVIVYSNSYKNRQDSLRLVKEKGTWLVDFKFIFKHKTDSLP